MEKFDSIARGALEIASSVAVERKNTELAPIHLLFGLVSNPKSYISSMLDKNNAQVQDLISQLPASSNASTADRIPPNGRLSTWLTQASANATQMGRDDVSERDLLKFMPQLFPSLDIDYSQFNSEEEQAEVPHFLVNLNEKATQGKLDPVIGRTKEIRAVMEILGRRSKNNPVLVGPAGVGKTAIVEGLAEAIVKGSVPDVLKGKTVYNLDLGALMAGTKYRGEFEERIQALLKFAKDGAGEFIIFIDEIHQIIGAGKTDGAMDAANLLKPALARGDLHCIGATTFDEYQKYVLKDPALERRFRQVPVHEPTKEDSIEILMGIKDKFEAHHGVKITDDAIYSAVMLSDQYITDKNLPDKAIDLIDESASALKLSAEAMPAELEFMQSEIRNKKILAQVENSKELEEEVTKLQKDFDAGFIKWEENVNALKKVGEIKNRLDRLNFDMEKAEREQNYEEASRLKYSMIPEVEKELDQYAHDWELNKKNIADIIARHTGIPSEKILKTKQESLLKLEENISKRVFGQKEAIHEMSESLLASYAGLTDPTRPLGSFLLKGPTGVGKTETAKALASFLFDNEENIIRLDMSEFSEKHSVAKLIGAPAGYVGYDDGGVLTEAVRRKPYSVILFDEIEKAHPDFSDILLQILDDGRLTDNKGRTINFKNTIVLLTTNSKSIELDFKPEVIGRLDSVLDFKALDENVMGDLVNKQIGLLESRLKNMKLNVNFSEKVKLKLASLGYDATYGARPLASVFNRLIVRPLSKKVLAGTKDESKLVFNLENGEITLNS